MVLVFVRRANDIDHLTPVVWALTRKSKLQIAVLCVNPLYDIEKDYRLQFLNTLPNVEVDYIYRYYTPSFRYRMLGAFLFSKGFIGKCVLKTVEAFWDAIFLPYFFGDRWALGLLQRTKPGLLIFDWVKPRQHVTRPLLEAAKRLEIKTVALPHGVSITTSEFRTTASAREQALPNYDNLFPFDWFVSPHVDHTEYFARGGMPPEKILTLGSARFCEEWVSQSLSIVPRFESQVDSGQKKLRVVFMDMKSYTSKRDVVAKTLQRLGSLDFIKLVVKPHTRKESTDYQVVHGIEYANEIPSVSLVRWADVVIGTVSSILIEPLCQGKPLLYPSFHVSISTRLEEGHVCWCVTDDDHMVRALRSLLDDPKSYPVEIQDVQAFLDEFVYANFDDTDVLGRYCETIFSGVSGQLSIN